MSVDTASLIPPADLSHATRDELDQLAESLYHKIGPQVMDLGRRFFGNRSDKSEELLAETFARVIVGLEHFKGQASHKTWIFRIAMNVAADMLRGKRNRSTSPLEHDTYSDEPTPSHRARKMEYERMVNLALERVSPEHRMVLTLITMEGLSHKDAADLLGVAEGTVWSRYARARLAFAEEIKKLGLIEPFE